MSLERDYTIRFFADPSQAVPGFTAMRNELDGLKAAANGTANVINQVGQQFQLLPAAANTGIGGATQAAGLLNRTFLGINLELVASLAAFRALQEGAQILIDLGARANNVREQLKSMAEETMKTREEMRSLANMLEQDSPNDEVTAGTVKFGVDVGMTPKQARKFLEEYHGSSPAGEQKGNVGPEGADAATVKRVSSDIARAGARIGQRVGLDTKTAGDITGVISQFTRIQSGEAASQQLGRIVYGLEQGRGGLEPLMRAFTNMAGSVVDEGLGPIKDLDTLAIMHGVMSTHHAPREAATYLKKSLRQLRDFTGPQGAGIREMGITPDMDGVQAIETAGQYLTDMKAKGVAPDLALQNLGFGDKAGIQALVEITNDWDLVQTRKQEQAKLTGNRVQAQDEAYFTRSLTGTRQIIDARTAASQFLAGHHRERVEMARMASVTRMRDEGRLNSGEQLIADKILEAGGLLPSLGIPEQMEQRVNQESIDLLLNEARRVGLTKEANAWQGRIDNAYFQHGKIGAQRVIYDQISPELFNDLSQKVMDRGGQPFGSSASISLKLGEIARPEAEKKKWDDAKLPRAPHPGAPGGSKPGAAPVGPAGGAGPVTQRGESGNAEAILTAMLDAIKEQTDEMRRGSDLGPFGTHPDFGGGFTPRRA